MDACMALFLHARAVPLTTWACTTRLKGTGLEYIQTNVSLVTENQRDGIQERQFDELDEDATGKLKREAGTQVLCYVVSQVV
ncbi:hypothetical protein EJB05_54204, partial [Eragrostis curvula]